jgi:hypothetical protein
MYLKEDHMSGKNVIVMGKKGVVANKTGSDGDTSNDEIYNVRFEDGSISNHPVRDMQMIGESTLPEEMDPKEHVRLDKATGMYCVYNKDGEKVKEFKDKADADKWATDNHDSLMEEARAFDNKNEAKRMAYKLAKKTGEGHTVLEVFHSAGGQGKLFQVVSDTASDEWNRKMNTRTVLRTAYNESVELDEASQRFGGDTNIPASPKTKKYIESGKGIILDVPSSLHPTARFAIYKNPAKGSKQDKVLMATISNPKRGRVKMFSFHGTHVSHQKAMDFAKHHKLVSTKDEKGRPLYAKESVELDEAKLRKLVIHDLDEASRPMGFPGAMTSGKIKGKFTKAQLDQLRDAYAKIGRVDPSSKSYENLTSFLDVQDINVLKQLAGAKIPFISSLALNRVNRAK